MSTSSDRVTSAAYPSAPKYAPGDSDKTLCQARYSTGEFVGFGCIERAKEERQGLGLCRVHAKVFDRWTRFGIDYVRSIVRLEWRRELA